MGIESDQIHIVAMVNEFGVSVQVETLDLSPTSGGEINHHVISPMDPDLDEGASPTPVLHLLYRPGHYDVLYPAVSNVDVLN